eukprot:scaffold2069_cov95-Skeletonema_marinoi.AAC.1
MLVPPEKYQFLMRTPLSLLVRGKFLRGTVLHHAPAGFSERVRFLEFYLGVSSRETRHSTGRHSGTCSLASDDVVRGPLCTICTITSLPFSVFQDRHNFSAERITTSPSSSLVSSASLQTPLHLTTSSTMCPPAEKDNTGTLKAAVGVLGLATVALLGSTIGLA